MDSKLRFRLLGSPQISWQNESFPVPRGQARALLYTLATFLYPVSKETLLALFWPVTDDATARKNLSRLVSYIRYQLPTTSMLSVQKASISLNYELARSDVLSFKEYCNSKDKTAWVSALSLYRGPFLSGFYLSNNLDYERWQSREQQALEHLYLSTLAKLAAFKREEGDYQAAIRYARQYLETDILAETIHRELIDLYAATGNRSAALKQYEICAEVLERELGVLPLPETHASFELAQQKDARKLATDSSLAAPEISWSILPSMDLPLIGREVAWQELMFAYHQRRTGGIILISGEAGVGKSRLMREFATQRARIVLTGNSHSSTQALPYYPLVQALRQALHHPELWTRILPIWLGEIVQLLPEVSTQFANLPPPIAVEPGQAQTRLLEAITQVFLGLAPQATPFLLCLDDLHWADDPTLNWLNYVSPRLANSQLCIVGTYRSEENDPIQKVRRKVRRFGSLAEVELTGLSAQSIAEILERVKGDLPGREVFARRLHQTTGGNAFFLLETIRALLERGPMDEIPETFPLPRTVQVTINNRLAILSPLSRQVLDAAAVLSPDLEVDLLWQTAGRTDLEVATGLDELVQRHILQEKAGALEFRHDLLRTTVYQSLNPWRRKLIHRRAGDALGAVYAHNQDTVAAQIAFHYDVAEAFQQAIPAYERAAKAAQAVHDFEGAIRHLQRAITLLSNGATNPAQTAGLYEKLAENLVSLGRFEEARDALLQAISNCPPDDELSPARLQWRIAGTHLIQLHYQSAGEHLATALALLGDKPSQRHQAWWSLWLDVQLDQLLLFHYLMNHERVETLHQEIEPVIERIGTPSQQRSFALRRILDTLHKDRYRPSANTIRIADAALKMARRDQNPQETASAQFQLGYLLFHADELELAEQQFLKALDAARETKDRAAEAKCMAFLSTLYRRRGDMELTAHYAQEAGDAGREVGNQHYQAHSLANVAWLAYRGGDAATAEKKAIQASEYFASANIPFAWIANMVLLASSLETGQAEKAVEAARAMLDRRQQRLPDELTAALEGVLQSWEKQDKSKVREFLEQAECLAKKEGYL